VAEAENRKAAGERRESPQAVPARDGPNQERRRAAGLVLMAAYPILRLAISVLGIRRGPGVRESPHGADVSPGLPRLTVFQAYQVGDCFMALPSILRLSRTLSVTVLCRPDCAFLFRDAGIEALGLENPFHARKTPKALWRSLRSAWSLRGRIGGDALDFDGDPRSALLLKVAGAERTHSYARPFGWLFDRTFALPAEARHQAEKNMAVAAGYLLSAGRGADLDSIPAAEAGGARRREGADEPGPAAGPSPRDPYFLLSCWTWKEEKNWPLEYWDRVAGFFNETGLRARILVPPDGDGGFRRFRDRWAGKLEFLAGDLPGIFQAARGAAGIICLDNFLGHMGAYLGKPVFWINGSSDPGHVAPVGTGTLIVQFEPMACRPCGHRCVNPVRTQCLLELRPERVLEELRRWLRTLPVQNGLYK